jgi:hypothetical protein
LGGALGELEIRPGALPAYRRSDLMHAEPADRQSPDAKTAKR